MTLKSSNSKPSLQSSLHKAHSDICRIKKYLSEDIQGSGRIKEFFP
jgi:hypothetical protein